VAGGIVQVPTSAGHTVTAVRQLMQLRHQDCRALRVVAAIATSGFEHVVEGEHQAPQAGAVQGVPGPAGAAIVRRNHTLLAPLPRHGGTQLSN
jgi:hypothetical protein